MFALVTVLGLLVPDLDEPVREDLAVADDRFQGRLAGEDLFERLAVHAERLSVEALRLGAIRQELRDPQGRVLLSEPFWSVRWPIRNRSVGRDLP